MKVAACQPPYIHNDLPLAVSLVMRYAADAADKGARLICFPECFLQGYDVRPDFVRPVAVDLASSEFTQFLQAVEACKPAIVVGLIERCGEAFYNAAVAIDHGRVVAHYRKTHLLKGELAAFTPGSSCAVFGVDGTTVGLSICNDLNFPDATEAVANAGAEVVVCPCNNMLPRASAEKWKSRHNKVRSERARNAGLWLVCSDVTGEWGDRISYGPTAVMNPIGTVIDQVPLMTTGMVIAEVGRLARQERVAT